MNQLSTPDALLGVDASRDGWRRLDSPNLASSDACRLALDAYERTFRQCTIVEPDVGFAERFVSGRRSLEARSRAAAWALGPDRRTAIDGLLDEVGRAQADEAVDWVDRFPRVFLGILERRTAPVPLPDAHGRRFGERSRAVQATDRAVPEHLGVPVQRR